MAKTEKLNRSKIRIAILDDEEALCTALSSELSKEGYVTTSNIRKDIFLKIMPEFKPHIIITDLISPVMDGVRFIENVRSDKRYDNVQIIVVSADARHLPDLVASRLRIAAVFDKPYNLVELLKLVEEVAGKLV